MLLRDLSDVGAWIKKIFSRLDRLEGGAMLENSSITNGRMRFIGGLLRLDAGARLEVEGSVGISGPTYLDGPVEITETLDVLAETTLQALTTILADLVVAAGGRITAGGLTITPTGDLMVGVGGRIVAGGLIITPSGELKSTTNLVITAPTVRVEGNVVTAGAGTITSGGQLKANSTFSVVGAATFSADVYFSSLPTKLGTSLTPNLSVGALWRDPANGKVHRIN